MSTGADVLQDIIDGNYEVRRKAVDERHANDVLNASLRKRLAQEQHPDLLIDEHAGYLKLAASDFPETGAVVQQGLDLARQVRGKVAKTTAAKMRKKYKILKTQFYEDPQILHSPIFRFALDPRLIAMVSAYLGYVPVLSTANFWYNPNSFAVSEEDIPALSDRARTLLSHLDWADNRIVKVFIHCLPVTETCGPIVIMNPQDSAEVREKSNYKFANIRNTSDDPYNTNGLYLEDSIIRTHLKREPGTLALVGDPGTVYMADTSRCFHYGGRSTSTAQERLLGVLLYLRPGALKLSTKYDATPPFRHLSGPSLPLLERLVLGEEIPS